MRSLNVLEEKNCQFVSNAGIPYVLTCLTENILKHSIFDARTEMRSFLKNMGIHDFSAQEKGQEHKVMIKTFILTFKRKIESKTSLYRSGTRGDERMWYGASVLPVTDPNDIYVVTGKDGDLYIVNITKMDLETCFQSSFPNPIKDWLNDCISQNR